MTGRHLRSAPGFEPPYTTADEIKLGEEADNLDAVAGRITGRGEQLRATVESGAITFSDLASTSLQQRGSSSMEATRQATGAAYFGATVMRSLAADVTAFKQAISDLVEQWEMAAQNRFGADPAASPAELAAARDVVHTKLMDAARKAKDKLDGDSVSCGDMLRGGPTPSILAQLAATGLIGWGAFNLFGDNNVATEKAIGMFRSTSRLSPDDLANLAAVLKAITRDPQAANRLLVQLRPTGLLRGYGNVVLGGDASPRLQGYLGQILALGTSPGMHAVSIRWRSEFVEQVDTDITLDVLGDDGHPIVLPGGRLIAPLLESGHFDKQVLLSLTREIQQHYSRWPIVPLAEPLSPAHPHFSSLSSALYGLAERPEAAGEFLGDGEERSARLAILAANPDVAAEVTRALRKATADLTATAR